MNQYKAALFTLNMTTSHEGWHYLGLWQAKKYDFSSYAAEKYLLVNQTKNAKTNVLKKISKIRFN